MDGVRRFVIPVAAALLVGPGALHADDLAQAEKLLAEARAAGRPDKLADLCERAYRLAAGHADGRETAVEAMALMAAKLPDKRKECCRKALAILEAIRRASKGEAKDTAGEALVDCLLTMADQAAADGDCPSAKLHLRRALGTARGLQAKSAPAWTAAVVAKRKVVTDLERITTDIDQARKQLAAKDDDAGARGKLLRLYVTERDDPAEAAKLLNADCDEVMRTYVPLACKKIEDVPAAACLELGNWYRRLAGGALSVGKPLMLRRARGYYAACLSRPAAAAGIRRRAAAGLNLVTKALKQLAPWEPAESPINNPLALVSTPAKLKGAAAWTIETRLPRGWANRMAFTPDGRYAAVGGEWGTIRLYDAANGELLRVLVGHEHFIRGLAFLPDGRTLVSAGRDRAVRLWDVAAGRLIATWTAPSPINAVAVSPDGAAVAVGTDGMTVSVLKLRSGTPPVVLRGGHGKPVAAVAWSPDGRWIASGGDAGDGKVCIWSAATKRRIRIVAAGASRAHGLAWSPDSTSLAIADGRKRDNKVYLWDNRSRKIVRSLPKSANAKALAWSPDGRRLACQSEQHHNGVQLWDTASWKSLAVIDLGSRPDCLVWSADGQALCACCTHGGHSRLGLWDAESGKPRWNLVESLRGPFIARMDWAADGSRLAWGRDARGGGIYVWSPSAGRAPKALVPPGSNAFLLTVRPDGKVLASAVPGEDTLRLWDAETGAVFRNVPFKKTGGWRNTWVAWSPDGKRLLACCSLGDSDPPTIFQAASGKAIEPLKGYRAKWYAMPAWSPNGMFIALHGDTGKQDLGIFNARTGRALRTLLGPGGQHPAAAAWSADSGKLVSAHTDKRVLIWDLRRGKVVKALDGIEQPMTSAAWSPDGRTIAAGEFVGPGVAQNRILLWDARTYRLLGSLGGHPGELRYLAWARPRGGAPLLASSGQHIVRIWDVRTRRARITLLPIRGTDALAVSAQGHFQASDGIVPATDIVYVVETYQGQQTLTPAEFANRYGWQNDPKKVRL